MSTHATPLFPKLPEEMLTLEQLHKLTLDRAAIERVPESVAREYCALPVGFENGKTVSGSHLMTSMSAPMTFSSTSLSLNSIT